MGIINTGISALLASQRALATTSHNVANASKEGYSRQRVELTTHNPQFIGRGFLGQGVYTSDIRRIQDEFVDTQLRDYTSAASGNETRAQYAESIDRLLGDANTGLAPALGTFFNAANDVASDPTSTVSRQVFLSEAESMVDRFNELGDRINDQRDLLNDQIKQNVDEINSLSESLADVNRRIVEGYGMRAGDSGAPNDLLDERGELLRQLAEKVDIKTIEQDNHSVSVFVGTGQTLVMGTASNALVAQSFGGDPRNLDIGLSTGESNNPSDITRFISGGELGGLLTSRSEILDTAQNGIGQIAVVLAGTMSQQNKLGLDLDGGIGGGILVGPEPYVGAVPGNVTPDYPDVQLNPGDISKLTTSDYALSYDGSDFQLRRLSDNVIVGDSSGGARIQADGLLVDTATIAGAAQSDEWLIQPTRFAAQQVNIGMVDPEKVATATAAANGKNNTGSASVYELRLQDPPPPDPDNIRVPAVVHYTGGNFEVYSPEYSGQYTDATPPIPTGLPNAGDAEIESFNITSPENFAPNNPQIIRFNESSQVYTYDLYDATGTFVEVSVPLDPTGTTTISEDGWELKVRGKPADGDTFNIVQQSSTPLATNQPPPTTVAGYGWELDIFNTPDENDNFKVDLSLGRDGDNSNMLTIVEISANRVIEGSATFSDSYDQTLGEIGTRTRQAQVSRDSSITLRNDIQTQRDSISGVNLDEEAANLLKYQKAYQAAAQTISVGNSMFDSLFAMFR